MSVPFVPCPLTAQVTMHYTSGGVPVENVFHFIGTADWTTTLLGSLLTYVDSWETTHAAPARQVSTAFEGAYAVNLATQNGPYAQLTHHVEGANSGNPLPNNVTLAFKLATPLRGKSFRGRTYWIGLSESQLGADSQEVLPTTVTGITSILELLRTGAIPNSGTLVVRSIRHDGAFRSSGVMTPVNGIIAVNNVLDSQRRRLPGHNVHR